MPFADLRMTHAQFDDLRKIVYEKSGISFTKFNKYAMENRLSGRLEELALDDYDQYLAVLTQGHNQVDELQKMFDRITINETSFFRNEPQLEVFETEILPALLASRSASKTLRIWSAACSTGEEPYTIAIQLHRILGIELERWQIQIVGTDISDQALRVAWSGRYRSYSVRTTRQEVIDRYFTVEGDIYQLKTELMKMVRFELMNLKDRAAARGLGTFDIIFCRNALIYFDEKMRRYCAEMFHNQLANDGALLIGHSESLRNCPALFDSMPRPQAFAYARKSALAREAA